MQKMVLCYRKTGITQRFNFKNTKQTSQSRVVEIKKLYMEKHCDGSNILCLEFGAHTKSSKLNLTLVETFKSNLCHAV